MQGLLSFQFGPVGERGYGKREVSHTCCSAKGDRRSYLRSSISLRRLISRTMILSLSFTQHKVRLSCFRRLVEQAFWVHEHGYWDLRLVSVSMNGDLKASIRAYFFW